jgi:hypothetical protein
LPLPVAGAVIVIQGALVVPVQAQPACAVTVIVPGPPAAPNDCEGGLAE